MKITLSWLKDHLNTSKSAQELADTFVKIGHEVEELVDTKEALKDFKVAKVLKAAPHPEADRLQICEVDFGAKTPISVVCGGVNARAGIIVIYAGLGCVIPTNGLELKKAKIRGVESCGMICSASELGLGEDAVKHGILELDAKHEADVGKSIVDVLQCGDVLFDIGLTPNRADCFGVYGLARDLSAADAGKLLPLENIEVKGTYESPIKVIRDKGVEKINPHFTGRLIRGVKNGPSPQWLQDKLKSVGLKSISALVDVTNYFSQDRGRPLHVFDADKLKGNLLLRFAKDGEKFKALDEEVYTLDDSMLVICDDNEIVSLAGIMGGLDSGCTNDTVNVFLEAAYFDAHNIAKTGQKLNIISDARTRFERGMDPLSTRPGIEAATQMILDLCGGEVSDVVDVGHAPYHPKTIDFAATDVEKLTGLAVSEDKCADILTALGCQVEGKNGAFKVTPPSWRYDMAITEDCVEEIIRIIGYDEVPLQPMTPLNTQPQILTPKMVALERAKRLLAARNLMETITYSFVSKELAKLFGESGLQVANPISEDMQYMRPTLLAGLMDGMRRNQARGLTNTQFFEAGAIFDRGAKDHQEFAIAAVYTGKTARQHWSKKEQIMDTMCVKADVEALLREYGVAPEKCQIIQDKERIPEYMHPGRTALICQGPKRVLGYFGAVHPRVTKGLDIKGEAFAFELYLDRLPEPKPRKKEAVKLSAFQPVERDFALIVDQETQAVTLQALMKKIDPELVQWVDVFDIYQGKGVEEGKKSVALRVRLQAQDRTLNEDDLKSYSDAALKLLKEKANATLR